MKKKPNLESSRGSSEPLDTESRKGEIFYEALLKAWVETRNEEDRTLVSFSMFASGGIISYMATVRISDSWQLSFILLSLALFIMAIFTIATIYRKNADYIQEVLYPEQVVGVPNRDQSITSYISSTKFLPTLDIIKWTLVIFAVSFAGLAFGIRSYNAVPSEFSKEKTVLEKNEIKTP